jgi:type I restriction enzyme S subunit
MLQNWKTYKLSEVFDIIGGGTPKTTVDEYWDGNIPWLSVVDFNNDQRTVLNTEKTITELGLQKSSTKLLKKGQLIISARGTVGKLAQLERDMAFNQSCYGLTGKDNLLINDYGYYLVKHSVSNIQANAHGSVFDTITRNTFENIEVFIPNIKEQHAIASILSALDDKIELNLQMNKTLEDMAMALYKHWFVDFGTFQNGEFVDSELGMIPKGWEVRSVYDVADYINGAAFKPSDFEEEGLYVIKIAELKSGISSNTNRSQKKIKETLVIDNGSVLFSWSATLDIFLWDKGPALLNQHIFNVIPNGMLPKEVLYFLLKNVISYFQAIAADRATTMGHIKLSHLKETLLAIPNHENVHSIDPNFKNMFEQILGNLLENQTLTTLRDTLLPKLISGEVRVKDIEQPVTQVL